MLVVLKIVSIILLCEGIIFIFPVVMIAIHGRSLYRFLIYSILCLMAFVPYIIEKTIVKNKKNIITVISLLLSIVYLLFFSGLTLITCSGHPPF
jgi:hypothetical protein